MAPPVYLLAVVHVYSFVVAAFGAAAAAAAASSFEALFQGHCSPDTPCHHLCFDLPEGTFECSCRQGYYLDRNGYSCIADVPNNNTLTYESSSSSLVYEKDAYVEIKLTEDPEASPGERTSDSRHFSPLVQNSTEERNCTLQCGKGHCVEEIRLDRWQQRCICAFGYQGDACEIQGDVVMPQFRATSWMEFRITEQLQAGIQVSIEFKPDLDFKEGVLLYSSQFPDLEGDFFAIVVRNRLVEFRFDCGSGAGVVSSSNEILNDHWNKLTVYQHKWGVWLQLNNGKNSQGTSKGLSSCITFQEPLYLGVARNRELLHSKFYLTSGFEGCIRHLQVNNHVYKFGSFPVGDTAYAYDIENCKREVCDQSKCGRKGKCAAPASPNSPCLCPPGYVGEFCEIPSSLQIPSFNGSSFLKYSASRFSGHSFDLHLVLRPDHPNGLLFYSGSSTGGSDFLAVALKDGHVQLCFDAGDGETTVTSPRAIPMGEWCRFHAHRTGRLVLVAVEGQPRAMQISPGAFARMSTPKHFWVGGVLSPRLLLPPSLRGGNFRGCIEQMEINRRPFRLLGDALSARALESCQRHACAEQPCRNGGICVPEKGAFSCACALGWSGNTCATRLQHGLDNDPMFLGNGYLHYASEGYGLNGLVSDIRLEFRPLMDDGLLLWMGSTDPSASSSFLALALVGGYVEMRYNLGGDDVVLRGATNVMDNATWHSVTLIRIGLHSSLQVDEGPVVRGHARTGAKEMTTDSGLYLGRYKQSFTGCISDLRVTTGVTVNLLADAAAGVNVELCQ